MIVVVILLLAVDSRSDEGKDSQKLIVPAGTEVRVEFTQPNGSPPEVITGKVAVPVRVGWATAIPATSMVIMSANVTVVELASVTIGTVSYKVKTNSMPLFTSAPGTDCELAFVLKEPLEIPR